LIEADNWGLAMVSIQSSSYGVSALVSSQLPSPTRNAETNAQARLLSGSKETGPAEGVSPAGGSPSAVPQPGTTEKTEQSKDSDVAPAVPDTDDMDDFAETEAPTWDEFEAAARFLQDSIDLREEDDVAEFGPDNSGITFDEAGTYRPAWIT
jgi:hypothetical protein